MKPAIIIGTKAEYIKMFPVMLELQQRKIDYLFIATGQHYLNDLVKKFGTQAPDIIINPQDGFKGDTGGAFGWAIKTLPKIISMLRKHTDIDYVIVHGDTISTLIASVAARLTGKQLCHVEAGLRSGNLREPFPEEIVRRIVDFLSHIKFAPSQKAANRLKGTSINTGNTSVDSLHTALSLCKSSFLIDKPYSVCTIHRHENIKSKERMDKILNCLGYSEMEILFFIHDNTIKKLKDFGLYEKLKQNKNIKLMRPIPYIEFSKVLSGAKIIFTDGGGMSEEAAELNIPCVILRYETEREELLDRWDQTLTKLNLDKARKAMRIYSLPHDPYILPNPYNGHGSSNKIVNFLIGFK